MTFLFFFAPNISSELRVCQIQNSYTVTILIKLSPISGLGISSGLILDEKMNIVTDCGSQWLLVMICKSVTEKSSQINKFLVVIAMLKNYRDLIEMVAKNPIETDPFEGPLYV